MHTSQKLSSILLRVTALECASRSARPSLAYVREEDTVYIEAAAADLQAIARGFLMRLYLKELRAHARREKHDVDAFLQVIERTSVYNVFLTKALCVDDAKRKKTKRGKPALRKQSSAVLSADTGESQDHA